jgi:hypothetical protein
MKVIPYREQTRAQLVAAIARHQRRATRRRRLAGGSLVALSVVGLAVTIGIGIGGGDGGRTPDGRPATKRLVERAPGSNDIFSPPTVGERVTLNEATSQADFPVRVPDAATASQDNMTDVYIAGDSVQMDFPPPNDSASDLRQPYLSVLEAPWTEGDPLNAYKDDIAHDPDAGSKSICSVNELPALCVEARSPSDETQENPAFLRVVIDKVEVEVMGGDSVKTLIDIATSLAKTAPSQGTSG